MAQRDIIKHLSSSKWMSVDELAKKCKNVCGRGNVSQSLRTMLKHGEVKRRQISVRNYITYEYRLIKCKGLIVEGLKLGSAWHKKK